MRASASGLFEATIPAFI